MNEYEVSKVLDYYLKLPNIFEFYGFQINHGFCCCPFHTEKSPSCKVNEFQFFCFGCGAKGNAVSFIEKFFNLSFKESIQKICFDFKLGLLERNLSFKEQTRLHEKQKEMLEKKKSNEEKDIKRERYEEAWKHFIWFEPENKDFNINTPTYLVDEFFNNIDQRYWKAVSTINELSLDADLGNFKLDKESALMFFTLKQENTYE